MRKSLLKSKVFSLNEVGKGLIGGDERSEIIFLHLYS